MHSNSVTDSLWRGQNWKIIPSVQHLAPECPALVSSAILIFMRLGQHSIYHRHWTHSPGSRLSEQIQPQCLNQWTKLSESGDNKNNILAERRKQKLKLINHFEKPMNWTQLILKRKKWMWQKNILKELREFILLAGIYSAWGCSSSARTAACAPRPWPATRAPRPSPPCSTASERWATCPLLCLLTNFSD